MNEYVIYAFGPFRLYTDTRLLWNDGNTIRLQPKVYLLLLYFVQNSGRLIFKKELFSELWRGRIVEETSLRLAVNSLRKALQDETKSPRYIMTTSKCGYRFLPEVKVESTPNSRSAAVYPLDNPNKLAAYQKVSQANEIELTRMLNAFEQISSGKRSVIFLRGSQGLGKTALIERFLSRIKCRDFGLLRARCVPLGRATEPFFPLLEALERRCQAPNGKLLIECLRLLAPTWLYQISTGLDADAIASLEPRIQHMTTGRMLREGADFLEILASRSAFVLILDNCHWSDEFTLDLVNFLAFRCSKAKLLVILSYRAYGETASELRLEQMRKELCCRGLCVDLPLDNHVSPDKTIHSAEIGYAVRLN